MRAAARATCYVQLMVGAVLLPLQVPWKPKFVVVPAESVLL